MSPELEAEEGTARLSVLSVKNITDWVQTENKRFVTKNRLRNEIAILSFIIIVVWAMSVYFMSFFMGMAIADNTTQIGYLDKDVAHLEKKMNKTVLPDLERMQDFIALSVLQPCSPSDGRCRVQRLTDMFGGKLPDKYQQNVVDALFDALDNNGNNNGTAAAN